MTDNIVTLDVCEDIRAGREPFSRIMKTTAGLKPGESLLLIAPFEPTPLYRMMAREGFANRARQRATGDWEVLFSRREAPAPAMPQSATAPLGSCDRSPTPALELDARGL